VDAETNLLYIINYIETNLPDAEIILHSLSYATAGDTRPNQDGYFNIYETVAEAKGFKFIDSASLALYWFQEDSSYHIARYPDNLHFNALGGQEIVGPNILSNIVDLNNVTLNDDFSDSQTWEVGIYPGSLSLANAVGGAEFGVVQIDNDNGWGDIEKALGTVDFDDNVYVQVHCSKLNDGAMIGFAESAVDICTKGPCFARRKVARGQRDGLQSLLQM